MKIRAQSKNGVLRQQSTAIALTIFCTVLVIAGVVSLAVAGSTRLSFWIALLKTRSNPDLVSLPAVSKTSSSSQDYAQGSSIVEKTFISPELGIRFTYHVAVDHDGLPSVDTKVVSNFVYVYQPRNWGGIHHDYPTRDDYLYGQRMAVFSKDPTESLPQAIRERILTGYDVPNSCWIESSDGKGTTPFFDPHFTTIPKNEIIAELDFPHAHDGLYHFYPDEYLGYAKGCPQPYEPTPESHTHFLMYIDHPNRFLFFDLGNGGVEPLSENAWFDTVTFTD